MALFPASPAPNSVDVSSVSPTLVSVAQSLRRQVRSRGGQRWAVALTFPPMLRATFAPVLAQCVALRGQYGTCTFVLPTPQDVPQGTWAGTPLVDGAAQTGRTVNLRGLSVGATVKAGDWFKFADSKVYMAVADGTASGAGKIAALAIEPALIVSPADGEALVYTSVPFTMQMDGDLVQYPVRLPNHFSYALKLLEAY